MTQPEFFIFLQDGVTITKVYPRFNGSDYSPKHDNVRLTKQIKRVFDLMKDGEWRTLDEIAFNTDDPEASVSAQLRNLRKDRFGAHEVNKRIRGERKHGLYEYQLRVNINK